MTKIIDQRDAELWKSQKNWFGCLPHQTDDLIHPTEVADTDELHVAQLRADWDLLAPTSEKRQALRRLLSAARKKAADEQAEIDAGPDL